MSETPHERAGDDSWDAPASDAEQQDRPDEEGTDAGPGPETGTPFASDGGSDVPGARTDEPREPDEPQRAE